MKALAERARVMLAVPGTVLHASDDLTEVSFDGDWSNRPSGAHVWIPTAMLSPLEGTRAWNPKLEPWWMLRSLLSLFQVHDPRSGSAAFDAFYEIERRYTTRDTNEYTRALTNAMGRVFDRRRVDRRDVYKQACDDVILTLRNMIDRATSGEPTGAVLAAGDPRSPRERTPVDGTSEGSSGVLPSPTSRVGLGEKKRDAWDIGDDGEKFCAVGPWRDTEFEAWRDARDAQANAASSSPIPMFLICPNCSARHIDTVFATRPHHTHACQTCGLAWRPAVVATVGVAFLPGFKDETSEGGTAMRATGEKPESGITPDGCSENHDHAHVNMEPKAPVPAPREVGRSGGASGVEAGAGCVDIAKARRAAQRLTDVAFKNDDASGEPIRPHFEVPAHPDDDDIILARALDELEALRQSKSPTKTLTTDDPPFFADLRRIAEQLRQRGCSGCSVLTSDGVRATLELDAHARQR